MDEGFDDNNEVLVKAMGEALSRFNPFSILDGERGIELWRSFKVLHKGKYAKVTYDVTDDIIAEAWPTFNLLGSE